MIKSFLFIGACILGLIGQAYAANPPGFLWYNVPKPQEAKAEKPKGTPFNQLSYSQRDAVLRFYTMEALHKVRFTHKMEDERVFLALQDYWLKEASAHGRLNQKTLLAYPQYDFSVTHPTSEIGTKLSDSLEKQKTEQSMQKVAQTQGLLFFYRAKNPYDQREIPIVLDFCRKFNFSLIPISVDGEVSPELRDSRVDRGQAQALGVRYFPALLLVNPKTKETKPVAFGLTTQDVLSTRILAVSASSKSESI